MTTFSRFSRLLIIVLFASLWTNAAVAERTYESCWHGCFERACREASKYYKQSNMWNAVEACQNNCKKNCRLFEKKKAQPGKTREEES